MITTCVTLTIALLSTPPPIDEDYAPRFGPEQTVTVTYEVDAIPGGKRFQGAWLVHADGRRWVVSYRPVPGHFEFIDRKVVVTGRLKSFPPTVQQIGATHFEVDKMVLAPGQKAHPVHNKELPAPPRADTAATARARLGRWVTLVGTLGAITKPPEGTRKNITTTIRLKDATIPIGWISPYNVTGWEPLVGKRVTVVGPLAKTADGALRIDGRSAICDGEIPRCHLFAGPRGYSHTPHQLPRRRPR